MSREMWVCRKLNFHEVSQTWQADSSKVASNTTVKHTELLYRHTTSLHRIFGEIILTLERPWPLVQVLVHWPWAQNEVKLPARWFSRRESDRLTSIANNDYQRPNCKLERTDRRLNMGSDFAKVGGSAKWNLIAMDHFYVRLLVRTFWDARFASLARTCFEE